jgi:hypothetical protein
MVPVCFEAIEKETGEGLRGHVESVIGMFNGDSVALNPAEVTTTHGHNKLSI